MTYNELATSYGLYWAIEPIRGRALLSAAAAPESDAARNEALSPKAEFGQGAGGERPYQFQNGIAILTIQNVMTKGYSWYYWGTSTQRLRALIHRATADEEVKGILLVVDSPGGMCAGCQELYDDIAAASKRKPFDVFVDDHCQSAAYYVSCAARRIICNRTGFVGSLGTMGGILDASKAFEKAGLEMVIFSTSPLKGAGTYGTEVTPEQRAMFQRNVEIYGGFFRSAISDGRKITGAKLEKIFTGESWPASEALALGLIDGIGSLANSVSDLLVYCDSGDFIPEDDPPEATAALPTTNANGSPIEAPLSTSKPTISTPVGGSTGQPGAGTTTPPREAGVNMKEKLIRFLAALGLSKMATALTVSTSEDPEALAQVMATQVEAEAAERVRNNPLILACEANAIRTPEQFSQAMEMRALGVQHQTDLRAEATAEAIRAFGPEQGPTISAQVCNLPPSAVKTLRDSWRAQADTAFGIGGTGAAPTRKTAPGATVAVSQDTEEANKAKTAWERLSPEAQAHAKSMGYKTAEKQEAYAKQLLGEAKEAN